jgi:mannosyltransferase
MSSSPNAEAVPARRRAAWQGAAAGLAVARTLARERVVQALTAVTVLGGVLRFGTLDARGYWVDETATVDLVRQSLRGMLTDVAHTESSPPLYFVLAWLWSKVFGTGEVGLRSLSALVGTATILVVYGVGAALVSRRAALAGALLAAVSPLLVWHAQDARPYALLILCSGLSLLFFLRALSSSGGRVLALWAIASALALATSYLTAFLVVAEAVWLLRRTRLRRDVLVAVACVGVVGLALLPYAIEQQRNGSASWIGRQSLAIRVVEIPAQFLVGYQPPLQRTSAAVFGLLVLVGLWLLVTRADASERRGASTAAILGGVALAGPLLLAVGGFDGLITRTVTSAWVPLVVVVAAGLAGSGVGRAGLVLLAAVCALSFAIVVTTASDPKFEREDWRGAARAVGPVADRAIVLSPENGSLPFRYYRPSDHEVTAAAGRVGEIVLIAFGPEYRRIGHRPRPPRPARVEPPEAGFREVQRIDADAYTLVRFRAPEPVAVGASLAAKRIGAATAVVLVEGGSG